MFGQGQFDDASEDSEDRMRDEMDLRRRALAYGRTQARPRATDPNMFMSTLGASEGVEGAYNNALSTTSPYYQRQPHSSPYHRPYMAQPGAYGAMHSPNDAGIAHYGGSPGFGYTAGAGVSPEQRHAYHPQFGVPPSASPSHHDFNSYQYGRQTQDMSQAALMERAYGVRGLSEEEDIAAASMLSGTVGDNVSPSGNSYMSKAQSKTSPSKTSSSGARGGRGGRGGRGRGGRGGRGRGLAKSSSTKKRQEYEEPSSPGPDSIQWYAGCVPLGLPEDMYWLSELQVYLRSNFAEAFGATEQDIAAPMHGRNKPIALGQVGIRCVHCKNDPPSDRGQQATSYPSLISGIYNSVQQMLRLHFDSCLSMPAETRQKIESLKVSSSARGGRKQYWIDSAKRLGLIDTPHGIHFGRDPYGPLPPLSEPSQSQELVGDDESNTAEGATIDATPSQEVTAEEEPNAVVPAEETYPLVLPEDKPLISDYLYLTLEQMQPCNLMEADKVGCYKGRDVGFCGLACRHCIGQAGCGRYFPASEASLSQTTTSQTIMNHVRNCRRCPIEIRENLELMKRARMGPDGKRADKPKHGGRKVFFRRLWCRIQRIPMDEEEKSGKKRGSGTWSRKKGGSPKKSNTKKRLTAHSPNDTSSSEVDEYGNPIGSSSDDETETEDEDTSSEEESDNAEERFLSSKRKSKNGPQKKKKVNAWQEGCVRLTKTDDPHWLSEMQCYVRSDLVEVFSFGKTDSLAGAGGRKEPSIGQCAVRCVFCKNLEEPERPNGYMHFPDSLSTIHVKINDMIRLHFPSCPSMSDDVKDMFRSLRGFGAKTVGDSQQYWIDAARDIGLANNPPGTGSSWGIIFRRNPLEPSPADELDRELAGGSTANSARFSFVRSEDRGSCTDHATLLLRQVKPCRFKKSDRRGSPGGRGRDRALGFPGLCCRHCVSRNKARYFPVSSKNLTDNTANSLQAHVASCNRCPEPIKASLAYLLHRSVLQKAELGGSWKKTFFKRVWDRLHVERAWSTADAGESRDQDSASCSSVDHNDYAESRNGSVGTDSDDEELGEDMSDLIKSAAIWLLEQDESSETLSRTRSRARGLPGKRSLPFSSGKGRSRGTLTAKRRRVHFP